MVMRNGKVGAYTQIDEANSQADNELIDQKIAQLAGASVEEIKNWLARRGTEGYETCRQLAQEYKKGKK